jgi:hypothetical protein
MRFTPGSLYITPACLEAFQSAGVSPLALLIRHLSGDWGEVSPGDAKENELSVKHGWRIMSVYTIAPGVTVWLITEADRASSTFLLPGDY